MVLAFISEYQTKPTAIRRMQMILSYTH